MHHLPAGSSSFYTVFSSGFDRRGGRYESVTAMPSTEITSPSYREGWVIQPHLRARTQPGNDLSGRTSTSPNQARCRISAGPDSRGGSDNTSEIAMAILWCPNSFLELRQLRCIPATADGLDQENAGIHSPPFNVDVIALIGQEHRLRGNDL
jgi:hypothetical protein